VSVRGGGHNYAGKSVCAEGLMIDLSPMKGIRVDPAARTARAQPGLRLGEFDRETRAFGLATTLGVNTDTGIAGLTLGGGYGWLGGKFGLACDNLLSADVVTADGRLVVATATENEDLLWGLRGAGANLGIVTSFEYRLHQVDPVLGGMVVYPLNQGKEALKLYDEFSNTCPDEVSTVALLFTTPTGDPAVAIAVCYCGPLDRGENVLEPLTRLGTPLANDIAVKSYAIANHVRYGMATRTPLLHQIERRSSSERGRDRQVSRLGPEDADPAQRHRLSTTSWCREPRRPRRHGVSASV